MYSTTKNALKRNLKTLKFSCACPQIPLIMACLSYKQPLHCLSFVFPSHIHRLILHEKATTESWTLASKPTGYIADLTTYL